MPVRFGDQNEMAMGGLAGPEVSICGIAQSQAVRMCSACEQVCDSGYPLRRTLAELTLGVSS